MDGFHLANATLDDLGRRDRKGSLDTFDGWGFVACSGGSGTRPTTRCTRRASIAPSTSRSPARSRSPPVRALVVVEGNYLLVDREPWDQVKPLLAESWFCVTAAEERLLRLVSRHTEHGRTPAAATAWATEVDEAQCPADRVDPRSGRRPGVGDRPPSYRLGRQAAPRDDKSPRRR